MKLVEVKNPIRAYKRTKLDVFIEEFVRMDVQCAECVGWEQHYATIKGAQNALNAGAKRHGYAVRASIRESKHLYLIHYAE